MLRVIQNKSAASAKSYYSHSDYLSEGQELVGHWHGKAASMLGLSGIVQKQDFDRLCDNLDPRTDERLTLRTNADRTVGYDFNFHLPKGVSLAYSLAGDDRIVGAFRASIQETMQEVEDDARTRVRKHGMQDERTTGNLLWSEHIHTTARPVDAVPDCHLHAHCFVFNVTKDEKEDCWKAGQFRELKRDAPYYEAAFHVRMANRMQELGYDIRRDGKDWDIAAFDRSTTQKFSRRTDQIEKLANELGLSDAKSKDGLGAKSRAKKEKAYTNDDLYDLWMDRLNLGEKITVHSLTKMQSKSVALSIDPAREAEAMHYAKEHCFERNSVIPKRQLLTEALRRGIGDVTVAGIHQQLQDQDVIVRTMEGRELATSMEVLAEERDLLHMVRSSKDSMAPINSDWTIQRNWLNSDQRHAVEHVLQTRDQVAMICGGAGTGKTSLMQEAAEGIEAAGHKLFTFAPSSDASRGVLRSQGFDATTVAELLVSRDLQKAVAGEVIWIDEAGLLGTRTLKKVMDIAEQGDCKLILSGDWKQHGSVERGAAMRLLEQQGGVTPARVRAIQRQGGEYKEVVQLLAKGQTDEGLEKLNEMGWVKEIEDSQERFKAIANEYAGALAHGETVLAVAPTHAEADLLTQSIRSELMKRGIVDQNENQFKQLKPLRLTEAQKSDPESVRTGDVVVFHQKAKNIAKGQRFDAKSSIPGDFERNAKKFDVFHERDIKLAKGDLLRITANGFSKDGKHRLNNGTIYRIQDFAANGDIKLSNGWTVDKDYGFLAPGYVGTSHASQGKTVQRVIIAESSLSYGAASREQLYVSVSRGTKSCSIYTDDQLGLMDAVSRSESRLSASELVQGENLNDAAKKIRQRRKQVIENQPEKNWEMVYERN